MKYNRADYILNNYVDIINKMQNGLDDGNQLEPSQSKNKNLTVIIADYDNCFSMLFRYPGCIDAVLDKMEPHLILNKFGPQLYKVIMNFKAVLAKIPKENKVVLYCGSSRQCAQDDAYNWQKNQNGSCFKNLDILCQIARWKNNQLTLADSQNRNNCHDGYNVKKFLQSDCFLQDNKITQVTKPCEKCSTKNDETCINSTSEKCITKERAQFISRVADSRNQWSEEDKKKFGLYTSTAEINDKTSIFENIFGDTKIKYNKFDNIDFLIVDDLWKVKDDLYFFLQEYLKDMPDNIRSVSFFRLNHALADCQLDEGLYLRNTNNSGKKIDPLKYSIGQYIELLFNRIDKHIEELRNIILDKVELDELIKKINIIKEKYKKEIKNDIVFFSQLKNSYSYNRLEELATLLEIISHENLNHVCKKREIDNFPIKFKISEPIQYYSTVDNIKFIAKISLRILFIIGCSILGNLLFPGYGFLIGLGVGILIVSTPSIFKWCRTKNRKKDEKMAKDFSKSANAILINSKPKNVIKNQHSSIISLDLLQNEKKIKYKIADENTGKILNNVKPNTNESREKSTEIDKIKQIPTGFFYSSCSPNLLPPKTTDGDRKIPLQKKFQRK